MPSPFSRIVADLFSLTSSDFSFDDVKRRVLQLGWRITEEVPRDFVLRVLIDDAVSELVASLDRKEEFGPTLYLPLFYTEDTYDGISEKKMRERPAFDVAFAMANEAATERLRPPTAAGRYGYPGQSTDYSYSAWRGERGVLFLVQDDFDIQFGSEITAWLAPADRRDPIPRLPLHR